MIGLRTQTARQIINVDIKPEDGGGKEKGLRDVYQNAARDVLCRYGLNERQTYRREDKHDGARVLADLETKRTAIHIYNNLTKRR